MSVEGANVLQILGVLKKNAFHTSLIVIYLDDCWAFDYMMFWAPSQMLPLSRR